MKYITSTPRLLPMLLICGLTAASLPPSSGTTTTASATTTSAASATYTEAYRPQFHFTTPTNWINDPNGLVYANGEYHLFFQYNPFGDQWGHMSWGHAISTDLVQWQHRPVAIPELETSKTMIFSGSAVVDENNTSQLGTVAHPPLVAIYTAHRDGNQSQALAYSVDKGRTWSQYDKNPVLDIGNPNFRDPKVFWHGETNQWVMIVSLSEEKRVSFYSSPDLKTWTHQSYFGNAGDLDGIWECPDLFELPVPGSDENKWVLLASVGKTMQYFIGSFDGKTFTNDNKPDVVLRPDYGPDFFAAITYNNAPADAGRICIGWMSNHFYAGQLPTKPWRGAMAVPRVLTLENTKNGLRLAHAPVSALKKLRANHQQIADEIVTSSTKVATDSQTHELRLTIDPGDATRFGIRLAKGGDQETVLTYDRTSETLTLDRTRSGLTDFSDKFSGKYSAPCTLKDGKIELTILVDTSSVEVFANDNTAMTALIFPEPTSTGVEIFTEDQPIKIQSLDTWELESIWANRP